VVPVNDRGEVGGALDPGETPQEAAVRELREETGIAASPDALTEPFHVGEHAFSFDGVDYLGEATFFALPLGTAVVDVPLSNLDLPRLMALAEEAAR
jgi:8-oxo-dGTP pyrophosphatase MutT (NUDIX family)